MKRFALGTPGQPVRAVLHADDLSMIDINLLDGEVSVESDLVGAYVISADGLSLEPYVPTLAEAQAARWAEAKAFREARILAGAATPSGAVDTTTESQIKMGGAVQMALIAQLNAAPFSMEWTMADNTNLTVDGPAMIAIGLAAAAMIEQCHAAGRAVRTEIFSKGELAEVAAVDITAGYPDPL